MGPVESEITKLLGELRQLAKAALVKEFRADLEKERSAMRDLERRIAELEQEDAEKIERLEKRALAREAREARESAREARMSLFGSL